MATLITPSTSGPSPAVQLDSERRDNRIVACLMGTAVVVVSLVLLYAQ